MATAKLSELLDATSYALLYVIAQQRGLTIPRNAPKVELVAALHAALSDPSALAACLAACTAAERAVLHDLVLAGGRLPRYHVARRHGDFRAYRPWMPRQPARPWESPMSPTERLYFLGLIFWDKATRDLVIPEEVLPLYPQPPRPEARAHPLDGSAPVPPVLHDVTQLLALIAADPPRPAHGRWLPPHLLRTWGQVCAVSPANPDTSGELRSRRRRFLHYLVTASGLSAPAGPVLALTPAAWAWLEAAPAEQLAMLWTGCAAPPRQLWATFRLPGYQLDIPGTLARALVREVNATLRAAPNTQALGTPEAVAARLLARDPRPRTELGVNVFEPERLLTQALVALLTGPWTWLGMVAADADHALQLTPWGAYLLDLGAAPAVPLPMSFTLDASPEGDALIFTAPGTYMDARAWVTVAACGERVDEGPAPAFRVTQAAWTRALHRGYAPDALCTRLNAIAQRPLSGAEVAMLNGWTAAAAQMRVHRVTVLDVRDAAILSRLQRSQRGRRLVLRTAFTPCGRGR